MPNWFNRELRIPKIKHSTFDLSNDYKTSMRIGFATPVGCEEILPSDKILSHSSESFIRFAPLKFPTMHRLKVHTSNFFVPFRIILGEDLYEMFLNGQVDIVPMNVTRSVSGSDENPFVNSVFDYLGYDVLEPYEEVSENSASVSLRIENPLPFLSYLCIIRDWYLDSNIQKSEMDTIDKVISDYRTAVENQANIFEYDPDLSVTLFNVAYSKDYFNTARPEPQLGTEMYVLNRPFNLRNSTGSDFEDGPFMVFGQPSDDLTSITGVTFSSDNSSTDAEIVETTTIRDLWRKEMLQRYFEIDNTFGSRIREKLAGHFGVRYSDQRIQIPLYCGGSSSVAQVSEVISTSTAEDGLGVFAGKATVADRSRRVKEYFEEHGYYITLLSVVPDNGYCRGQQRTFFKKNIFDFASPEFNNIGWQDILKGELYLKNSDENNGDALDTWGYQPRYSEYRSHPSRCTGAFRTSAELAWHLNRNFDSVPPLNSEFIKVSDVNRVFSAEDITDSSAPLYVDVYHHLIMSRPIAFEPDAMHLY